MPITLADYQFVIDTTPEVPFGVGQAIAVEKFDPGGFGIRDQDKPAPISDAMLFGIDRHTPPVWTWNMWTDAYTPGDALGLVDLLGQVWEADATRGAAGRVMALRYTVAGRTRRVYGRPRRFTPVPALIQHGRMAIVADFQLAEKASYDELEESVTVQVAAATVTGRGFKFPVKFPLFTATTPAPRTGQAVVRGTAPTWLAVAVTGPVSNPWVQIGDQRYALTGAIPTGETITLSGRSWDQGVLSSTGVYKPQMLDPRSRLSQLRFNPGLYSVSFGGFDSTGTARATVRWRNAYRSM